MKRPTPRMVFRARVNLANTYDRNWRKAGWTTADIKRIRQESREIIQAFEQSQENTSMATKLTTELVPLKTLCSQLKIEPRAARRTLRKAKITGHSARDRWTFKKGSPALTKAKEALRAE